MSPPHEKPIIFFDGVCGLCDHFVGFVLEHDGAGVFLLSPLQGETAKQKIGDPSLTTVVLWESGKIYYRSDAVLRILARLGSGWKWLTYFRWVPRPLRDGVYAFIAKYRYRWFGKRETCRFPSPDERTRFLP